MVPYHSHTFLTFHVICFNNSDKFYFLFGFWDTGSTEAHFCRVKGAVLIQSATLSGHKPLKNSDPPSPSLLARCGASQKRLNNLFLFYLINICPSFKQLYNKLIELKYVSANGAKQNIFIFDRLFFLSTEVTNALFKRDFNSYKKCMTPFFANVTLNPIDHIGFRSVIFDFAGTGVTFVNLIVTAKNYLLKQMFFIIILKTN